jgi:hypothetical protein
MNKIWVEIWMVKLLLMRSKAVHVKGSTWGLEGRLRSQRGLFLTLFFDIGIILDICVPPWF